MPLGVPKETERIIVVSLAKPLGRSLTLDKAFLAHKGLPGFGKGYFEAFVQIGVKKARLFSVAPST